jgi:hypothetical protein
MAKLPRTTQKIFGKNAPENQITTFGSIKAGTPVYTQSASQIMNSAFEGGWSEAVEDDYAPYRQDRNAVDTAITQQLGYLFQDGIPEWDAGTTYYKGSVVKVVNGNALTFYKSIADNNTSSVNTTDKWHKMLDINASNQIVSPSINTPTISGGSMSSGTFSDPTFSGTVNVPLASASSSTDSTIAASIGWVNNPSLSSNVVHRTGDETIAGSKTFVSTLQTTTNMVFKRTTVTKGTNPESTTYWQFFLADKNGGSDANSLGKIQTSVDSNGLVQTSMVAYKNASGTSQERISIYYPTSGSAYTYAPTPDTSDNSTKIATTAYVKAQGYALDSAVVKLTGDQTIAGTKTFTGNIIITKNGPIIQQNNTNITKGTAPSSNFNNYSISYRDNNGNNVGSLIYHYNNNKDVHARLVAYKSSASTDTADVFLRVFYTADGHYGVSMTGENVGTDTNDSLVNSTTSTTSTTLACMGWVNSRLNNTKGNVTISGATNLTSSISLGSRYTFGASGLLVLTIQVKGQTNPAVEVRMSDSNNASASSQIVTIFGENGGSAEYFQGPLTFPIKKGNSIYLNKTGTGSATVERAYLFAWNNS